MAQADEEPIGEVVVTGYRAAIESAVEAKREANGMVDVIKSDEHAVMSRFFYPLAEYLRPWKLATFAERRWRHVPLALILIWLSVDGSYAIYWHLKDPWVLETMRSANAPISLVLYCLCGFIWLYRGSLRDLYSEVCTAVRRHN